MERPRLHVENQLGYKMVKRIERIEFVESETQVGEGATNDDEEYFDSAAEHLTGVTAANDPVL